MINTCRLALPQKPGCVCLLFGACEEDLSGGPLCGVRGRFPICYVGPYVGLALKWACISPGDGALLHGVLEHIVDLNNYKRTAFFCKEANFGTFFYFFILHWTSYDYFHRALTCLFGTFDVSCFYWLIVENSHIYCIIWAAQSPIAYLLKELDIHNEISNPGCQHPTCARTRLAQ